MLKCENHCSGTSENSGIFGKFWSRLRPHNIYLLNDLRIKGAMLVILSPGGPRGRAWEGRVRRRTIRQQSEEEFPPSSRPGLTPILSHACVFFNPTRMECGCSGLPSWAGCPPCVRTPGCISRPPSVPRVGISLGPSGAARPKANRGAPRFDTVCSRTGAEGTKGGLMERVLVSGGLNTVVHGLPTVPRNGDPLHKCPAPGTVPCRATPHCAVPCHTVPCSARVTVAPPVGNGQDSSE
jgi:hypothetical protein